MPFRIQHPDYPESKMYPQNHDLKRILGFTGKYAPDQTGTFTLPGYDPQGNLVSISLVLLSKAEAKRLHPRSNRARRLHAICPGCNAFVCAGHTVQHKC